MTTGSVWLEDIEIIYDAEKCYEKSSVNWRFHKIAIIRYNRAVLEAFKEEAIVINDLHKIIYQEKERLLSEDMIHPNEEGIKRLGAAVASMIKAQQFEERYHIVSQEMIYTKLNEKIVQ